MGGYIADFHTIAAPAIEARMIEVQRTQTNGILQQTQGTVHGGPGTVEYYAESINFHVTKVLPGLTDPSKEVL